MALADVLRAQRARSLERLGADAMSAIASAIDDLRASRVPDPSPGPGDRAPDVTLPDAFGETIRLGDLLGRRAVVLAFYRGSW